MTKFEKAVRHELIEREMSLSDLAEALQISNSYLYELLSGTRKSEEQKERIRKFLNLKEGDLSDEQDVSETNS